MILMWGETMSDLISRSALYDKLIYDTTKTATVTGGEYIATWRIADVIAEAPTIDAVPVDKIQFTDLYLDGCEAIAVFKFGNQGITLRKKCDELAPVVRCKDCKFRFRNNGHDKNGCPITDSDIWMDDSGFCSDGERKDDDTIDCEADG